MIAAVYHRGMGSSELVTNEFGTLTNFADSLNGLTVKWHDSVIKLPNDITVSDPMTKKILGLSDHFIEDYKSDECKQNQVTFARMADELNGSSSLEYGKFHLVLPIVFLMKLADFL